MAGKLLTRVLGQSEHIHALIKQAAEELSSLSAGAKREPSNPEAPPEVSVAVEINDAISRRLQEASENMAAVNQALQIEIRDRTMVDYQLAAAVEQEEGSRSAALRDYLTGLPNRVLFKDRLEHGIAQAKRHQRKLGLMFVDLNNFKNINDTYGHQVGDAVLQGVATRLQHNTRNDDTISRYGGDELLYLLTQLHDQADITMIAAKILEAIRAPLEIRAGDVVVIFRLEASIGMSMYPAHGVTASALIKRADEAMYVAKENKSGFAFAP